MKNQNYLMTGLAIVGAISLFILACAAAEESNDSNNNNSALGIGRYQITDYSQTVGGFHVIDTETGVVKSYYRSSALGAPFILHYTTITQ